MKVALCILVVTVILERVRDWEMECLW